MPEEHKIFMEEYEKYGNNCTLIAKVLNTWTPAQIKKHAECFFQQNLRTNSAAVKRYRESISPDKKAQILITDATEHQNYRQSLSAEKKTQILCNNAEGHRKQGEFLHPEKKITILQTDADARNKKWESLSPKDKELFDKNHSAAQNKYCKSLTLDQKAKELQKCCQTQKKYKLLPPEKKSKTHGNQDWTTSWTVDRVGEENLHTDKVCCGYLDTKISYDWLRVWIDAKHPSFQNCTINTSDSVHDGLKLIMEKIIEDAPRQRIQIS